MFLCSSNFSLLMFSKTFQSNFSSRKPCADEKCENNNNNNNSLKRGKKTKDGFSRKRKMYPKKNKNITSHDGEIENQRNIPSDHDANRKDNNF